MSGELAAKRLGLLHELIPPAARFAALINPSNPHATEAYTKELAVAASAIRLHIEILTASTNREIDVAFASFTQKLADALLMAPDILFAERRVQLVILAAHHRVPVLYPNREDVDAGGLMSYGPSSTERYRLAGVYTGRVLKGKKPADLPILRASKLAAPAKLATATCISMTFPHFPVAPNATLRPPDALVADYRLLQKRIGTTRNVVVTPSTYGTEQWRHPRSHRANWCDRARRRSRRYQRQ